MAGIRQRERPPLLLTGSQRLVSASVSDTATGPCQYRGPCACLYWSLHRHPRRRRSWWFLPQVRWCRRKLHSSCSRRIILPLPLAPSSRHCATGVISELWALPRSLCVVCYRVSYYGEQLLLDSLGLRVSCALYWLFNFDHQWRFLLRNLHHYSCPGWILPLLPRRFRQWCCLRRDHLRQHTANLPSVLDSLDARISCALMAVQL